MATTGAFFSNEFDGRRCNPHLFESRNACMDGLNEAVPIFSFVTGWHETERHVQNIQHVPACHLQYFCKSNCSYWAFRSPCDCKPTLAFLNPSKAATRSAQRRGITCPSKTLTLQSRISPSLVQTWMAQMPIPQAKLVAPR